MIQPLLIIMRKNNKFELSPVKIMYKKILQAYPFLKKTEEIEFKKKAAVIIKNSLSKKIDTKSAIKNLLYLLNNRHADIKEWHKPNKALFYKIFPFHKIKDRVLFVTIPSWSASLGEISKKLIDICVKNNDKYDYIIIDVRENGGGTSKTAHNFAGIFFKSNIVYGKFIKKNENGILKTSIAELSPNKNVFIDKSIAILISRKCFSSNELFLAPFKISKRAVLFGESTAGGSANPISEMIKIGKKKFVVRIPTWRFFLKGENKPIEETKIKPDIVYKGENIEKFARDYLFNLTESIT